jgi:hypothetical protein
VITVQNVQNTMYVSRVDVQTSVRERTGSSALVQMTGRVMSINHNGGTFVVRGTSGDVTVSLPYNAPQATVNYFRQLRVGHEVRLEATMVASGRAEIHRFL